MLYRGRKCAYLGYVRLKTELASPVVWYGSLQCRSGFELESRVNLFPYLHMKTCQLIPVARKPKPALPRCPPHSCGQQLVSTAQGQALSQPSPSPHMLQGHTRYLYYEISDGSNPRSHLLLPRYSLGIAFWVNHQREYHVY